MCLFGDIMSRARCSNSFPCWFDQFAIRSQLHVVIRELVRCHFCRPISIRVRYLALGQCAVFKSVIPSVRYDPVSFRYTRGCQSCRYTRRSRRVSTGRRKLCIPWGSHSHQASNSPPPASNLSVLHDNDLRAGVKSRESSEEAFSS